MKVLRTICGMLIDKQEMVRRPFWQQGNALGAAKHASGETVHCAAPWSDVRWQ